MSRSCCLNVLLFSLMLFFSCGQAFSQSDIVVKSVAALIEKNHADNLGQRIRFKDYHKLRSEDTALVQNTKVTQKPPIEITPSIETFDVTTNSWKPGVLNFKEDFSKFKDFLKFRDGPFVSAGEIVFADRAHEYKSVYYFEKEGKPFCTAVGISQGTIATAKHCLDDDANNISLLLDGLETPLKGACEKHNTSDIALCSFATEKIIFSKISSVDLPRDSIAKMVGVGCDRQRDDFDFRTGDVQVLLSASQTRSGDLMKMLGLPGKNPEDKRAVTICPGDSGGPTFSKFSKSYDDKEVIGINRHCNAMTGAFNCTSSGISYITVLFPHREWVDSHTAGAVKWADL